MNLWIVRLLKMTLKQLMVVFKYTETKGSNDSIETRRPRAVILQAQRGHY